jgi:hypothetical protein
LLATLWQLLALIPWNGRNQMEWWKHGNFHEWLQDEWFFCTKWIIEPSQNTEQTNKSLFFLCVRRNTSRKTSTHTKSMIKPTRFDMLLWRQPNFAIGSRRRQKSSRVRVDWKSVWQRTFFRKPARFLAGSGRKTGSGRKNVR